MLRYFKIFQNVVSEADAALLTEHINTLTRRRKYEGNHWDSVIAQYKELELSQRNTSNSLLHDILLPVQRLVQQETKTEDCEYLPQHAIDLSATGFIAPHVDSIKASGGVVAGLSLLSPRILQLTIPSNDTSMDGLVNADTKNKTPLPDSPSQSHYSQSSSTELGSVYEFILHPRSLYILQGPCRFQYAHAVLGRDCVSRLVPGTAVGKIDKRLSIMFRDAVPIKHVPKF